ncbi:MAG: hypothetical protein H6R28_231 [Methanomicrobiales archaeon]|nr:hypothetical protein [Methanomicrobiales archaeon]MDD1646150.1 hypothetical protein [Methanomicrobiales archaeon]
MPEITNDERGRRLFQIQKERAVEVVIEKVRRSLGTEFRVFSPAELEILKYILGETWVAMERALWERCSFAKLKKKDVEKIIRIGKETRKGKMVENTAVDEVRGILDAYI